MVRSAAMASSVVSKESSPGRYVAPDYPDWQSALSDAVRDLDELCRLLRLDPSVAREGEPAAAEFPLLVPRTFLGRIGPGDPQDPLLLQVLPQAAELARSPQFRRDPLRERSACSAPGLLQKYQGRCLMVTTGACCVQCRFCFRRHFPYETTPATTSDWLPALEHIARDDSIHEVILSGGDPLCLEDSQLAQVIQSLEGIPHLRRLRIHTRFPVMTPQRVTKELLGILRGCRFPLIMVVHINHPGEVDARVAEVLSRFVDTGISVLNQAVLLRGINDQPDVLAGLCEGLVDLRVMPYYLHQLDRVAGAMHFEVPETTGVALTKLLRTRLPGYAVPHYVREVPGGVSKEILA